MYDIDPENNDGDKEIFYARVRMNMIGERIWNSLNQVSQTNLHVHSKKYTWKDSDGAQLYDGPTMLQILVQTINPSTMVGISTLKDKLDPLLSQASTTMSLTCSLTKVEFITRYYS